MRKIALTFSAATFVLAATATGLSAHQAGGSTMMQNVPNQGAMPYGSEGFGSGYGMYGSGMYGPGMFGPGMMMGGGMMGHGASHMMAIMMDTDGDGSVSLEEFQALQVRMFNAMDLDKDGKLTSEEMEDFMWGGSDPDGDE